MQTLAEILHAKDLSQVFRKDRCDFCEKDTLVYADPETGCLYCLRCLAEATDPASQLDDRMEDEPADPALIAMAREIIAAGRMKITKGNTDHANN